MTIVELRNSILSISNSDLLGTLPIFAAAKVLDPDLKPKGGWQYAAAALHLDNRVSDRLKLLGNPFDTARLSSDIKYRDLVNSVVSALRGMSFSDYLRIIFPELVPNPDYLAKNLQHCGFRKRNTKPMRLCRLSWSGLWQKTKQLFSPFQMLKKSLRTSFLTKRTGKGSSTL